MMWRKVDDWTLASSCGRYEIKRRLDYDNHPASNYAYWPRSIADDRAIGTDKFSDSILARQACEDDLTQLQQAAAQHKTG